MAVLAKTKQGERYGTIKIDKPTLAQLKVMAGDRTLTGYLRELAMGAAPPPPPQIDRRLAGLEAKIDSLSARLNGELYRLNSKGEKVLVIPSDDPDIPWIVKGVLDKIDEVQPRGEADFGFYHRTANGEWQLVTERVEKAGISVRAKAAKHE